MNRRSIALILPLLFTACLSHRRALPELPPELTRTTLGDRSFLLSVPESCGSEKPPCPLLFGLHGGGGDAASFERIARMTSKSRNSRVILAIPEASNRHWNDGRKEGESKEDDVAFLDAIVLAVSNRFPVDRKRVCATGISNGALLSFRLACERSETYSAIIPVAAHLGRELSLHCRPSRPVSILHIAGTLDPLVPVGGGQITGPFGFRKRGEVLSAEATLRFWEERNRNFPEGRAEIRQVLLPDAGHAWPGGWAYLSETLIGPTPPTPDASGMALRFCIDHPKVDQYEASDHIFSNRPR